MICLYNTASRKIEEFVPLKKTVGLYTCGPTVYHYAHIGNLRSFILSDVLRRTLEYFGYRVKQVMNITDVGHLVSDADTGEEKIAAAARREKKTAWEVADFYTKAFQGDLQLLNIKKPSALPRATQWIKDQITLIKLLEKKGFTYRTSDGIYFATSKLPSYGQLAGQRADERTAGKRVAFGEKKYPTDFALWKFSPKGAKREMEWKSPWGTGFPGWHTECAVMSRAFLGQPFDIHTGGIDLIFPHHTNEIAQSEAAYGEPLARYWLHGEFIVLPGEGKMAKSAENIITVGDIQKRGIDPLAFRYFTFTAHYRKPLTFSWEALAGAQNALRAIRTNVRTWEKPKIGCAEYEERFAAALADDLDLPRALAITWELVKSGYPPHAKAESLLKFDQVLGLDLKKYLGRPVKISAAVKRLLAQRVAARKNKDWQESDRLRQEIAKLGFSVEDTNKGQEVSEKIKV